MIAHWNECSSKRVNFTLIIICCFSFKRNNLEMLLVSGSRLWERWGPSRPWQPCCHHDPISPGLVSQNLGLIPELPKPSLSCSVPPATWLGPVLQVRDLSQSSCRPRPLPFPLEMGCNALDVFTAFYSLSPTLWWPWRSRQKYAFHILTCFVVKEIFWISY